MTIVEVRERGVWPLTSKWAAAQDGQSIVAESAGPVPPSGDRLRRKPRIRRARNKYVSKYRRADSAAVIDHGGRGKARPENTWALMKAEAFEEALSRVSRRVATLARQAALELRAERLAAARRTGRGPSILGDYSSPMSARLSRSSLMSGSSLGRVLSRRLTVSRSSARASPYRPSLRYTRASSARLRSVSG
jgi:hypothetical protein